MSLSVCLLLLFCARVCRVRLASRRWLSGGKLTFLFTADETTAGARDLKQQRGSGGFVFPPHFARIRRVLPSVFASCLLWCWHVAEHEKPHGLAWPGRDYFRSPSSSLPPPLPSDCVYVFVCFVGRASGASWRTTAPSLLGTRRRETGNRWRATRRRS